MGAMIYYKCSKCGQANVKLWRDYNTFLNRIKLLCAACASPPGKPFVFEEGDQIGWMVPAVPTEEMDTFWGYSAVPANRVLWWYSLRTYPDNDTLELDANTRLMLRWKARYDETAEMWLAKVMECCDLRKRLENGVDELCPG